MENIYYVKDYKFTDIYLLYQVYNNQLIMNGIQEIKRI